MRTYIVLILTMALFCTRIDARSELHHWVTKTIKVPDFKITSKYSVVTIQDMMKVGTQTYLVLGSAESSLGLPGFNKLYKTSDTGVTLQAVTSQMFSDSLGQNRFFVHEDGRGCIVGFQQRYLTSDIGSTWSRIQDQQMEYYRGSDSYANVIVTNSQRASISISEDFGQSWRKIPMPDSSTNRTNMINYLVLADSASMYLLRQDVNYNTGSGQLRLFSSRNLGKDWMTLRCPIEGFENDTAGNCNVQAIKFVNRGSIGLACISYRDSLNTLVYSIVRSTDTGMHWTKIETSPFDQMINMPNRFYSYSRDTIFMIYRSGCIKVSTDAGLSWSWFVKEVPWFKDVGNTPNYVSSMGPILFESTKTAVAAFAGRQDGVFNIMYLADGEHATSVEDDTLPVRSLLLNSTVYVGECYPMPATRDLQIVTNFTRGYDLQAVSVEVYDLQGQRVATMRSPDVVFTPHIWGSGWYTLGIPLANLEVGTYIVNVCDGRGSCRSVTVCHTPY